MKLEDRLRSVADELEIRNLVARLAHLADDADDSGLDAYIALYTEDASWESKGFGVRRGHADLMEGARERRAQGTQGPGTNTRHVISTHAIDVHGDTARGTAVFHFYKDLGAEPSLSSMGVYEDDYLRTPDGWRLNRRVIRGA